MFTRLILQRFISVSVLLLISLMSFSQGKIIVNGATVKMVNGAYVVTKDVSVTNAGTVDVNNSTIKIADSINHYSGIFDVTAGTVELNGIFPQTIPVNAFSTNKIHNLVISNNVTLQGQDSITNILSFGGSNNNFNTGGLLTLKSTALNTARVADITNGGLYANNTFTGKVKVERYISAIRAWRFLSAPIDTAGAQTIKAAWQEGAANSVITYANNINPLPGFGAHIVGGTTALGFDKGINTNATLKTFKTSTATWEAINSTNRPITDFPAYMLFFRGDRSTNLSQGVYAAVTSSVLRSTGVLKTGDQSFTIAATGFSAVGNPYASPIDLSTVTKINVQNNFYLWDPKITGTNGVGGFVTLSWDGSKYDIIPAEAGSGLTQYIQSGSAFFAKSLDGTSSGTLVVKETDKNLAQSKNANRGGVSPSTLKTNLYSLNADGTVSIVDGILNSQAPRYSDNLDEYDAVKLANVSESLSSQRGGKSLVVERKQPLSATDTIFLNMLQMKVKSYRFEFIADNFLNNGLSAFLEDSYFNTSTLIDLQGATTFDFNVVNIPGSWNPARFRIVFKQLMVLPVTFSSAKAFAQNEDIKVEWKVQNEDNIKQYDIEKSFDGRQFVKVNMLKPKSNGGASNYNWLDENAYDGNNYYRIKSIGINGEIKYSSVMNVKMGKAKSDIVLITNLITNKTITFKMNNMPKGIYAVKITNNLGQLMFTKKIEREEGFSTETIQLNQNFASGIYHLTIISPDFTSISKKLMLD